MVTAAAVHSGRLLLVLLLTGRHGTLAADQRTAMLFRFFRLQCHGACLLGRYSSSSSSTHELIELINHGEAEEETASMTREKRKYVRRE